MIFFLSNTFGKNNTIVRFISNNTLTIMGIHIPFNGIFAGIAKNVFHVDTSQMPVLAALIIAVMSVCCSLVFAYLMHRSIPVLIGERQMKNEK
jgi:surface polysaccharide O-acyltransferase-like enzyme